MYQCISILKNRVLKLNERLCGSELVRVVSGYLYLYSAPAILPVSSHRYGDLSSSRFDSNNR
jgi:hypothetical protein